MNRLFKKVSDINDSFFTFTDKTTTQNLFCKRSLSFFHILHKYEYNPCNNKYQIEELTPYENDT